MTYFSTLFILLIILLRLRNATGENVVRFLRGRTRTKLIHLVLYQKKVTNANAELSKSIW